MDHNNIW